VNSDITPRKRAEAAGQERAARLLSMVDAAPVMVWMCGPDGGDVYLNRHWVEFTGRPLEAQAGDGWLEGVHPEDAQTCLRRYREACAARRPFEIECRLRGADGEYRWVLGVGVPVFDDAGAFAGYIGSCLDLTERRRGEELEAWLSAAVQSSGDAIVTATLEGTVVTWNAAAERLFGYPAAEAIGQPCWIVVPPERREEPDWIREQIKAGRGVKHFETQRTRKDGHRVVVVLTAWPITGRGGAVTGVSLAFRDVGQQKWSERQLRLTEALNEAILASLPGTMAILDEAGTIIRVNAAWMRLARANGGSEALAVGVGLSYLEACRAAARAGDFGARRALYGIEAVLGEREEFSLEYGYHPQRAEGWFVMTVHPLKQAGGGAIISHLDITERRRGELQLDRFRRELAHRGRVIMLTELAGSLAHELHQPLTAILNNAAAGESLLGLDPVPLGELQDICREVRADARRAAAITHRMRRMLRKGEPAAERVDVNAVVHEVVVLVRSEAILRQVAIVLDLAPALPPVRGDRVQLQQVLLNLIMNALDATDRPRATARRVTILTRRAAEGVAVEVRDTGEGFAPGALERAFHDGQGATLEFTLPADPAPE